MRSRRLRRLSALAALAVATFLIGLIVGAAHQGDDRRVAQLFSDAWRRGDYPAMHELITQTAKSATTADELADAYRTTSQVATTLGAPVIGQPRRSGDLFVVPVAINTRVFGTVRGAVRLPFVGRGENARIEWQPHMTFPDLNAGERLERTTEMPPRARLLARDGTPLAEGPNRSSPLGTLARSVAGDIGSPPPNRVPALRRAGVPDDAQVGTTGLERIFDQRLRGRPGGRLLAGTRVLAEREPRRGRDVRTSIARSVQEAAVAALGPRLGGIVALRPETGEILAFAGIPFSGLQPPGSTFKIVTLAGALEHGIARPSSTYPFAVDTTISGVRLSNADGESCGGSLALAFAVSCNSVFAPLGVELGARRLVAIAEAFGFNRPTGLPGAATSRIPAASEIGDDLAVGSTAIGQGRVQATALQMARVAATISLGGRRAGLTLDVNRPAGPGPQVIRRRVAEQIRDMMVGAVRNGTGRRAEIPSTTVAGKTGTAELRTTTPCVADPATGRSGAAACPDDERENDPTDTDAWFTAFAPAAKPRVAVGVLLVQSGAGGDTAAPAARQVLLAGLKLKLPR